MNSARAEAQSQLVAAHALLEGEQQARLLEERQVRVPEQQRLAQGSASAERLQSSN
jgi:hypothetical protein